MRPPPSHLTVEHQRAAGRARAVLFTKDQLSAYGRKGAEVRTRQEGFYDHLLTIAPDGPARQRVAMRAPKGSRLLNAEDVHLVRLEDIGGNLGEPWPESKRRLLLARYVWAYIWSGLREPARPTQQEFFALAAEARARVGQGLALLNPLHVVGVAPDDFCNADARPYGWRNQRRLFRAALQQARDYACLLQALDDYFAFVLYRREVDAYFAALEHAVHEEAGEVPPPEPRKRVIGRRHPMSTGNPYAPPVRPPRLPIHWSPIYQQLGRPLYHPARFDTNERSAYRQQGSQMHAYWLPPDTPTADNPDEEEGVQTLPPVPTTKEPTHDTA
jgi:hypothetical protein